MALFDWEELLIRRISILGLEIGETLLWIWVSSLKVKGI